MIRLDERTSLRAIGTLAALLLGGCQPANHRVDTDSPDRGAETQDSAAPTLVTSDRSGALRADAGTMRDRGGLNDQDAGPTGAPDVARPSAGLDSGSDAGGTRDAQKAIPDAQIMVPTPTPSAHNPCPPAGAPCRILAFGDSITGGAGSTDESGYRGPLFRRARAARQSITFVGGQQDGPTTLDGVPFPTQHEGHPGARIADLSGSAGGAAAGAHIVLLMIGTNDMEAGPALAAAPARLAGMIDNILKGAPNALLVVAQIVPSRTDARNKLVEAFNAAIPDLVKTRAAAGKPILVVDMFRAFSLNAAYKTAYLKDDAHPNDAGFAVMANVWYQAMGAVLR